MTQRTITIKLTSELLERALTEAQKGSGICRTCLVVQALNEADGPPNWVCGYSHAGRTNRYYERIVFPEELVEVTNKFTELSKRKSEARRWFAQRELESKEFTLTAVRQ